MVLLRPPALRRYQETGERLAVEGFKLTDELAKQKLTLQVMTGAAAGSSRDIALQYIPGLLGAALSVIVYKWASSPSTPTCKACVGLQYLAAARFECNTAAPSARHGSGADVPQGVAASRVLAAAAPQAWC